MNIINTDWKDYYNVTSGRPPSSLLIDALSRYPRPINRIAKKAIDLGCGEGIDTVLLLNQGWEVFAVDGEESAIEKLLSNISVEKQKMLSTKVSRFEKVDLHKVDLVFANFSIPFCSPANFNKFWTKIENSINAEGRFVGQFFGPNDSWAEHNPHMTFHSKNEVKELFINFDIEHFLETDEDGKSTSGNKHWHIFEVIAKKVNQIIA